MLERKLILSATKKILIKESDRSPKEDTSLKSTFNEKLDHVLEENDPDRIHYHQIRCDYKVYLENLEGLDNDLRLTILRWQNELRLKAKLLTKHFNIRKDYTPTEFFYDFFKDAENLLLTFVSSEKISGDIIKLLHGIVFELAAECPLDWRK